MNYENSLTRRYVNFIRDHVLRPIETKTISESCFATAILLFAGIDGLGKLIHENPHALSGRRFRHFIARLGPAYAEWDSVIWGLRCSLSHNALNADTYMSKLPQTRQLHLQCRGDSLLVNTLVFAEDFALALSALEEELQKNVSLLQQTESRITAAPPSAFDDDGDADDCDDFDYDQCFTTPPPFGL